MEFSSSQKTAIAFAGAFVTAGLVLSILVFPFWNLIREDVFESVEILANDDGTCYVTTSDNIPKIIEDCTLSAGDNATIRYGQGLAWGTIVSP